MAKRRPPPTQYITLTLDEIVIPEVVTPGVKSFDRFQDVIPEAMVHYLRRAERFPFTAAVAYEGGRFMLLNTIETARAARIAGFTRPLVCVLKRGAEKLPAPLLARLQTVQQVIALDAAQNSVASGVLCFSRPLSDAERVLVEDLVEGAERAVSPGGPPNALKAFDREWPTPDVFAWRIRLPEVAEWRGALEWMKAFRTMLDAGIPVVALDGRTPPGIGG
jgi:hypothetical protein